MMLAVGMSLLTVVSAKNQLEAAKANLFSAWTTDAAIAQVTLGLPTKPELTLVIGMVKSLREEVIESTGGDLTMPQRELDVPFMLGMLDGIEMEYSPLFAKSCVENLAHLDDTVSGIAASRIWRMRLRAAIILNDQDSAKNAARSLLLMNDPDAEDMLAATLFEIQMANKRGDLTKARTIFADLDATFVQQDRHMLRGTLASGYARIAPSASESLFGWFHLAPWYFDHGVHQSEVDQFLLAQLERLEVIPSVTEDNKDERLEALAIRLEVEKDLVEGRMADATQRLLKLARAGDIHAAERILIVNTEPVVTEHIQEVLAIVLSHPTQTRTPIAYWWLFAATRKVQQGDYDAALTFLMQIPESSPYFQRAKRLTQHLQVLDVDSMLMKIQRSLNSDVSKTVSAIVDANSPAVIQELLKKCIGIWHLEGDVSLHWLRPAVATLLDHETEVTASVQGEAWRLLGKYERARPLFLKAIESRGETVQTTAGLADCTRDVAAMQRVIHNTSHNDATEYWYWLSNVRLLQWHLEDGGQWTEAIAKINRLRRIDEHLGGTQFAVQLNALSNSR